jgi:hypothetical protein
MAIDLITTVSESEEQAMDMAHLVVALAPAFAAGFALQRLLEILDPIFERLNNPQLKKIILGLISFAAGLGLAAWPKVRVLKELVAPDSAPSLLDYLVTALIVSGGTEGFNSILKFLNYKKEETKGDAQTKAVNAARVTAALERKRNMACTLTRKQVSILVLQVIGQIQHDDSITEATEFGPQGINNDAQFRTGYAGPIKLAVESPQCRLTNFSASDCANAETVGDIVDAVWADLDPDA